MLSICFDRLCSARNNLKVQYYVDSTLEYLRESEKYSIRYWELMNGQHRWQKRWVTEKNITRTIADLCGFVMDQSLNPEGDYFNYNNDFAWDDSTIRSETRSSYS